MTILRLRARPRLGRSWRFRRSGVGLAICDETITVCAIRRSTASWTRTVRRERDVPLVEQLGAVLDTLPRAVRSLRRRIVVAVGGRDSHVKCIAGVPTASTRSLRKVVAAGASRFFPAEGGSLLTGGVRCSSDGVWTAAYSREFVVAVGNACKASGISRVTLVPLVTTLSSPGRASSALFDDSGVETRAHYDELGLLVSLERRLATAVHSDSASIVSDGGAMHPSVAASIGAVTHAASDPLALKVNVVVPTRSGALRLGLAVMAFLVSVAGAVVAPGIIAANHSRAIIGELRAVKLQRVSAMRARLEVAQATQGLAELAEFDRHVPVSLLIARITRALPIGSAIVMLQMDSLGASVVLVGPRAADLVGALEHVVGLSAPTIVGPIAPEQSPPLPGAASEGGPPLQRVTIRVQRVKTL